MQQIFKDYPEKVRHHLRSYLIEKSRSLEKVNKWTDDLINRLIDFSTNGKMVRGSLVLFSQSIFSDKIKSDTIKAASAIELFHSGLLIHDDIMDHDFTRRAKPSIYYQYIAKGKDVQVTDTDQFGVSMGICSGDIGFFFGFELISSIDVDSEIKNRIMQLFTSEFVTVGFGQMQDVYFGHSTQIPDEHDVFNLYLYKTARYTFSLPFMLGALLGGVDEYRLQQLENLGELMGMIFQIRDDEIGIYGDGKKTGKPVGSDIFERKKTIYYLYISQRASDDEIEKLHSLFKSVEEFDDKEAIPYLHSIINRYRIKEDINKMVNEYNSNSIKLINDLDIKEEYKKMLFKILNYNLERTV